MFYFIYPNGHIPSEVFGKDKVCNYECVTEIKNVKQVFYDTSSIKALKRDLLTLSSTKRERI